jgi:hypothetical protein
MQESWHEIKEVCAGNRGKSLGAEARICRNVWTPKEVHHRLRQARLPLVTFVMPRPLSR